VTPENKKTVRRLDLIRGTLVLTLILYIVVALIMNSSYLTLDRLMRLRADVVSALAGGSDGRTVLEPGDTVDVVLFQDGYAVLTRNGISIRSGDGSEYSSHILRYRQPCVRACGNYLLCYDRGGTEWALLNSFRVLCSGTEPGDIVNGAVSDDGYFAVASEREDAKGSVTVYNDDGLDLLRWNSEHYLIDTAFLGKNRLAVVSVAPNRENTDTVFTVLDYKQNTALPAVAATNTFPLALGVKGDGSLEMLTASGVVSFDGETARTVRMYPEPSPGVFFQGKDATVIVYHTLSGGALVEVFSPEGTVLFSSEYPTVLSVGCYSDRYFVLTATQLFILDSSGQVLDQRDTVASQILVSPEISVLVSPSSAEALDFSALP